MGDLIDRQAAIDAVRRSEALDRAFGYGHAVDALRELPSAQPETHEERTETHACDCISRQAAIDAHYEYCNKHPDAGFPVWSLKILEDLPSAQPEIIRCKDCIFHGLCRTSTRWAVAPKDDWFCADAERRTDVDANT